MHNNKVVLVTGSSSGIGLATAQVLANSGFNVMMHGLESNEEGLKIAQALSSQTQVDVAYCSADLSDPSQVDYLYEQTCEQFGHIDVLVNNAGIQFTERTENFPRDKWDLVVAINLTAPFQLMQRVLPNMMANKWGRIINIASVHGLVGSENKAAYCAAKHGMVGYTKVVALEQATHGVTANCICPGWTDTPLLNHQFDTIAKERGVSFEQAKLELVNTKTPYPGLVSPDAIGAMAAYLCSDQANAITGAALPIDGAWTSH
ncbi:MAG: 3-hydroxybutyrate dehydrogenase [Pontibacterium sp.]